MKILITGGCGFIGSHLAEKLSEMKVNKVTIIDNFSTGKNINVKGLPVKVIKGDVCDQNLMRRVLKDNYDVIYHLAAIASVDASVKDPNGTHKVNFDATLQMLDILVEYNMHPKVLFASSAAVYGDTDNTETKREDSLLMPKTPYAIDKLCDERYLKFYSNTYNIPVVIARFFNVYGSRQDNSSAFSGVLSLIMKKLKNDSEFTIYGTGNQIRDFIDVEDVIEALLFLSNKGKNRESYNVASGKSISLNNVIDLVQKVTNKELKINYLPERQGDIKISLADNSKLRNLGWHPQVSLEEGLAKYWHDVND